MSFLQPLLLLSLPLIGLPIVIHLLNHRRHKTAKWAATRFVIEATSINRGMAVLRHWLILALRVLAIAALILGICRPLVSRVPGLEMLGGQRTQIIVCDRSPSMAIQNPKNGLTARENVLAQLQSHSNTVGLHGRQLLFHSHSQEPVEVNDGDLLSLLETSVSDAATNIPQLIEDALNYVQTRAIGAADIWVTTDRQAADWRLDSGKWSRIRQRLAEMPEVRMHFLTAEAIDAFNLAISTAVGHSVLQALHLECQAFLRRRPPFCDARLYNSPNQWLVEEEKNPCKGECRRNRTRP